MDQIDEAWCKIWLSPKARTKLRLSRISVSYLCKMHRDSSFYTARLFDLSGKAFFMGNQYTDEQYSAD